MLHEEHAAIEAKQRGLTYAGFGYWKDKSGYTVAKTVDDELKFIPKIKSVEINKQPVDIPNDMWVDKKTMSHGTPFNRPRILQKRYVNFKELNAVQMSDILKIAKFAITSITDKDISKQDPPAWRQQVRQSLSNKKFKGMQTKNIEVESGADKIVIIGHKWVIKISTVNALERERDAIDHLAAHPKLHKYIPETHFFNYKNYGIQIQRRYDVDAFQMIYSEDRLEKFHNLVDTLGNLGFGDIHQGNVGWDSEGNPKLIDLGE